MRLQSRKSESAPIKSSPQVKWLWILLTFILVGVLGLFELSTNPEISIALLYLIPVAVASWFIGRNFGIAISAFIVAMWTFAEIAKGKVHSSVSIHYWYAAVRLIFFLVVTTLLVKLKTALNSEMIMSRLDFLTDVMNSRSFYELATVELERCKRYKGVLSVAYMDMDNLKVINDKFGHSKGDDVLRAVAGTIKENLRKTDIVARMGGDEFIILFPETEYKAADRAVKKIQDALKQKKGLREFSITFSIGILTCESCPESIDKMIELVDSLMYSIKSHKKDGMAHSTYK